MNSFDRYAGRLYRRYERAIPTIGLFLYPFIAVVVIRSDYNPLAIAICLAIAVLSGAVVGRGWSVARRNDEASSDEP